MAKENIISAVIHVDETTPRPSIVILCRALTAGNPSAKDVIGVFQKENAQDAR